MAGRVSTNDVARWAWVPACLVGLCLAGAAAYVEFGVSSSDSRATFADVETIRISLEGAALDARAADSTRDLNVVAAAASEPSRPAGSTVSRDKELPAGIRALIVDPGIGAGQFISRMLDVWQVSTMMAETVAAALAVLDQSPAAVILARGPMTSM